MAVKAFTSEPGIGKIRYKYFLHNKLKELYGIKVNDKIVVINYHTSTPNRDWDKVNKFYELAEKINKRPKIKQLINIFFMSFLRLIF